VFELTGFAISRLCSTFSGVKVSLPLLFHMRRAIGAGTVAFDLAPGHPAVPGQLANRRAGIRRPADPDVAQVDPTVKKISSHVASRIVFAGHLEIPS
jgi:hypothetical protein